MSIDTPDIQKNDETKEKNKVEHPPKYGIHLLNSDYAEFSSVIETLSKAFDIDEATAFKITHSVHFNGIALLKTYANKDLAETKKELAYQTLCELHEDKGLEQPSEIFSVEKVD